MLKKDKKDKFLLIDYFNSCLKERKAILEYLISKFNNFYKYRITIQMKDSMKNH
jgi:hypothetical protein